MNALAILKQNGELPDRIEFEINILDSYKLSFDLKEQAIKRVIEEFNLRGYTVYQWREHGDFVEKFVAKKNEPRR